MVLQVKANNEWKKAPPSLCMSAHLSTNKLPNKFSLSALALDICVNRAGPINSCMLVACLSMRSVPHTLDEIDLIELVLHIRCRRGCTTLTLWPLSACRCMKGPANCRPLCLSTMTPRNHWLVHLLGNLLIFFSFLLICDLELLRHYVLSRNNQILDMVKPLTILCIELHVC